MIIMPPQLTRLIAEAERRPDLYRVAAHPENECQTGWAIISEHWHAIVRRVNDEWFALIRDEDGHDGILDMEEAYVWLITEPTGAPEDDEHYEEEQPPE